MTLPEPIRLLAAILDHVGTIPDEWRDQARALVREAERGAEYIGPLGRYRDEIDGSDAYTEGGDTADDIRRAKAVLEANAAEAPCEFPGVPGVWLTAASPMPDGFDSKISFPSIEGFGSFEQRQKNFWTFARKLGG